MTTAIAPIVANIQPVIDLVTDSVTSKHTKRAYSRALAAFITWHVATGQTGFNKAVVQNHITHLRQEGVPDSSVNQRITAIKKLAHELADNGIIDEVQAQAQRLLDLPDLETLKGLRDRAILAVLLGCGLRREECAALTVEHIQQRDGRWVIVDLVGKRNKMRSVPMPSWAKVAIDTYRKAGGVNSGALFRPIHRGGHIREGHMRPQSIFDMVSVYAEQMGVDVRPHDLRRTFAKLAHKGSAPIEQIQLSMGHNSVATTERYIGVQQDLHSAPCDVLGLKI